MFAPVVGATHHRGIVLVGAPLIGPLGHVVDLGPLPWDVTTIVLTLGRQQSGRLGCSAHEQSATSSHVGHHSSRIDHHATDPSTECGQHCIVGQHRHTRRRVTTRLGRPRIGKISRMVGEVVAGHRGLERVQISDEVDRGRGRTVVVGVVVRRVEDRHERIEPTLCSDPRQLRRHDVVASPATKVDDIALKLGIDERNRLCCLHTGAARRRHIDSGRSGARRGTTRRNRVTAVVVGTVEVGEHLPTLHTRTEIGELQPPSRLDQHPE
jgi:hypothetical protein